MSHSSSSSSSSSSKLPFWWCDRELGKLLREGRVVKPATESGTSSSTSKTLITEDIMKEAEELRDRLRLFESYKVDDESEDSFPKHWVANVRDTIEAQLDQIKLKFNDNAKHKKENDDSKQLLSSTHHQVGHDNHFRELVRKHVQLTDSQQLLLMVFTLVPENRVVNKREALHLWRGLDYNSSIEEDDLAMEEGERILEKLVLEGLISSITTNYLSNKYMMQPSFRSWLLNNSPFLLSYERQGGFDVGIYSKGRRALINFNNEILNNSNTITISHQLLDFMWNADVVHLGSCRRQPTDLHNDDYIVIHMEFLHFAFKQMEYVRFLSFRGTSGIVHFPDSVSNLNTLRFLDLSACNNLESLPKGIESLENLISLDLSECYLLDHIPLEITSLSNLKVLKGFIIELDPHSQVVLGRRSSRLSNNCIKWWKKKIKFASSSSSSSPPLSSCPFTELFHLKKLEKLTLRTRRMNFPTSHDLDTLSQLTRLQTLGITWVGNPSIAQMDGNSLQALFPNTVEKLELQSSPQATSHLLKLIGKQKEKCRLKKLYIRGGAFQEMIPEKYRFPTVKIMRLRYLGNLNMEWDQFKESFPNLTCLEFFQCPNLTSFPCDENGIWK